MYKNEQPTNRFSDRVENYVKYRPSYPSQLVAYLAAQCGLQPDAIVADIGSGTGKLTRLFVEFGCTVYGVEPNEPMRLAAESMLAPFHNFISVDGSAENSTLAANSADLIIAGQAFHWFEPRQARRELARIVCPGGHVCLIWNERLQSDRFQQAYDQFLHQYAINYGQVNHRNITPEQIARFYAPDTVSLATFSYTQTFDLAGLMGRALSSSYTPNPDHPKHAPFVAALAQLFEAYQVDGYIHFCYQTKLYYGRLTEASTTLTETVSV